MPKLADNRYARFAYSILEEFEAGIVLTGQEVKAAKQGLVNLKGSYATVRDRSAWLINCHIGQYRFAARSESYDPTRTRKLLLAKRELAALVGKLETTGLTLIPLSVYTKAGLVKVGLALGRGKKRADKRESIKKREVERNLRRALRQHP